MVEIAHQDRLDSIRLLTSVVKDGKSLGELLRTRQQNLESREAARLQELSFGTIRWSYRLDAIVSQLQRKPLRHKDTDVRVLLWQALYEILYMRTPDYAVVNSYAALTKRLRKHWAKALVNATLRGFLRCREEVIDRADAAPEARYSLPLWVYDRIVDDWENLAEGVCAAGNRKAPLVLRVNQRVKSRQQYVDLLRSAGLQATLPRLGQCSVEVSGAVKVQSLPGFEGGQFSVQDSAAQLAAELLLPVSGERVLDACAAPGGKTCHLLEMAPDINLLAIDNDPARLQRVKENIDRLGLQADLKCADSAAIDDWWDGCLFDAVLLDAPCSAVGVLRRHPDIRRLRRETDIPVLAARQGQLLKSLWQTVRPGGRLIYVTCSVLKQENEAIITAFLAETPTARERPIEADWGFAGLHGRQILPGQHDSDGFYYAILDKR